MQADRRAAHIIGEEYRVHQYGGPFHSAGERDGTGIKWDDILSADSSSASISGQDHFFELTARARRTEQSARDQTTSLVAHAIGVVRLRRDAGCA
jgi:hypothetical protein